MSSPALPARPSVRRIGPIARRAAVALVVLLPLVTASQLAPASAASSWTLMELRPLPGDVSSTVASANESGWAVGRSITRPGELGRPVLWDPSGNPTLLPQCESSCLSTYTLINDAGVIVGADTSHGQVVMLNDGVTTVLGNTDSYAPVAISNDRDPKVLMFNGDVVDTAKGGVTTLPYFAPQAQTRFVGGMDADGTAVGVEYLRSVDPIYNGTTTTNIAVSYDAYGAHHLAADWPYPTQAGPVRGGIIGVGYNTQQTCPQPVGVLCPTVPTLLYRGAGIPLDYTDQFAAITDLNTSGLAIGSAAPTIYDQPAPVLFVYGAVVRLDQLVPVPAGVTWISAVHITNSAAIYANAARGTTYRAFVLRPA